MNEYPLIQVMGLKVYQDEFSSVVRADDIEKALQDAPEVYGHGTQNWDFLLGENDSHKARLVCIQPMKKKTKAEAAIELLREMIKDSSIELQGYEHDYALAIKKILEMPE